MADDKSASSLNYQIPNSEIQKSAAKVEEGQLEGESFSIGNLKSAIGNEKKRCSQVNFTVKLLRAHGGCLGTSRR